MKVHLIFLFIHVVHIFGIMHGSMESGIPRVLACTIGPSTQGICHCLVLSFDIHHLQIESTEEFMPPSPSADGAGNGMEILGVPMLEAAVVSFNLDKNL